MLNEKDTSQATEETQITKPEWLQSLEAQSWQAELLISSVVIFSLLALPDHIMHYMEGFALESSEFSIGFIWLISCYLMGGIYILIFVFILHFALRALWITLLGLNSIYPEGIKIKAYGSFSENLIRKIKQDYPNLTAYNKQLDDVGSLMFSNAAFAVMLFASFCFLILLGFALLRLAYHFFPAVQDYLIPIGLVIYFIILLPMLILGQMAKSKRFNQEKTENKLYQIYKWQSKTMYTIFNKPVNYISHTLATNSNTKFSISMVIGIIISMFVGAMAGKRIVDSPVFRNMAVNDYYTFNNRPNNVLSYNYDNLRAEDLPIFTPTIPSDVVHGSVLKLFIPSIERDKKSLDIERKDGIKKRFKNSDNQVYRDSVSNWRLQQYKDFNQIFINEIPYSNLDFRFHRHPHHEEAGLLVYIPTADLIIGQNVLEIRKQLFSDDGIQKIVRIPFYFEGN